MAEMLRGIHSVLLYVQDVEASLAYYRETHPGYLPPPGKRVAA